MNIAFGQLNHIIHSPPRTPEHLAATMPCMQEAIEEIFPLVYELGHGATGALISHQEATGTYSSAKEQVDFPVEDGRYRLLRANEGNTYSVEFYKPDHQETPDISVSPTFSSGNLVLAAYFHKPPEGTAWHDYLLPEGLYSDDESTLFADVPHAAGGMYQDNGGPTGAFYYPLLRDNPDGWLCRPGGLLSQPLRSATRPPVEMLVPHRRQIVERCGGAGLFARDLALSSIAAALFVVEHS